MIQQRIPLDRTSITSMGAVKSFKENTAPINSVDFSPDGELVISSSDDESIHLYNAVTGKSKTKVYSKKYGVDLVRFTRGKTRVVHASKNGWDESMRYLSLNDNHYLRYFTGHRDRVVALSMSSSDDTFLSASLDLTVRLWDLRTTACQGLLRYSSIGRPALSYDPAAIAIALASSPNTVSLYDKRSFDSGPFNVWQIDLPPFEWKSLQFSTDGKYMLLLTSLGHVFVMDAFNGHILEKFEAKNEFGVKKPGSLEGEMIINVCFTPDAQFVVGGSNLGRVYVWQCGLGTTSIVDHQVCIWDAHTGPITALQWNPSYMMMATAENNLKFWLPQKSNNHSAKEKDEITHRKLRNDTHW